ncbi:MAG: type II toxin-antitoxin system Phd/YefM family antitoxin [Candidatus Pelagadaptatus aseana]|uniref:type II toxin-antitoxin system Phd/YefM family antitoxin n=1 Tax=Candidatus Pelagadaptatus aseana TaxID=3120508 RepID=UPI0039B33D91
MSGVTKMMAGVSASITEFKANPNSVIQQSDGEAVAVLKSNEPCFYAVPPALFEMMTEAMEDLALLTQSNERLNDGKTTIEVSLNDL